MLEGKCPNSDCGKKYCGWALLEPKHQRCNTCGEKLIITEKEEVILIKICQADAFYAIDSPDVWVNGVSVCRIDMKNRVIQLLESAKVIYSERPRGIMIIPLEQECDKKNVLSIICDRHA
jgi:DNA-directed RNA polymerase subunit RPC12/RpoP